MKFKSPLWIAITTAILVNTTSLHAQSSIKPGLWEETITVKRNSDQAHSITSHVCLSGKDLDMNRFDQLVAKMKQNKSCQLQNFKHSEHGTSSEWICSGSQVNMHGSGEVVYDDATHFHVTTEEHSIAAGHSIDTSLTAQSHWMTSDCGSVKPLDFSK